MAGRTERGGAVGDERLRRAERALALAPEDHAGWLGLAHERLRRGELSSAVAAAGRASAGPPAVAAEARAVVARAGLGDGLWPDEGGCAARRQRSPLDGPVEGVMRWRVRLPRAAASARPLVDPDGAAWVRTWPAGLVRVAPSGALLEDRPDWPACEALLLLGGAPAVFDPTRGGLTTAPDRPGSTYPAATRAEDGLVVAAGAASVVAVGPEGFARWSLEARGPRAARVALGAGAVYVAQRPHGARPARVRCLDREEGAERWSWHDLLPAERPGTTAATGVGVAVAPDGAVVVTLGHTATVLALEPDGAVRWRLPLQAVGAPALRDDAVVLATSERGLVALDLQSGRARWARPDLRVAATGSLRSDGPGWALTGPPLASLALDGRGVVHAPLVDGRLVGVEPDGRTRYGVRPRGEGYLGPPGIGLDGTAYVTLGRELLAIR